MIHRQREGAAAHVTAGENGGGLGNVVIHSAGAPGDDPLLHHQLAVHHLVGEGEGGLAAELLRRPLLHLTQIIAGIVEQLPQRHPLICHRPGFVVRERSMEIMAS